MVATLILYYRNLSWHISGMNSRTFMVLRETLFDYFMNEFKFISITFQSWPIHCWPDQSWPDHSWPYQSWLSPKLAQTKVVPAQNVSLKSNQIITILLIIGMPIIKLLIIEMPINHWKPILTYPNLLCLVVHCTVTEKLELVKQVLFK